MLLNPDPMEQAIEVCFTYKRGKEVIPPLKFNNDDEQSGNTQKHLPLVLDSELGL